MIRILFLFLMFGKVAHADVIVAGRVIPANTIISPDDLQFRDVLISGGITDTDQLVGMEARHALFAGRPILAGDVTVPAVVDRNEIVQLIFERGGLHIKTEGRALNRGAPGDVIRVMNLTSRKTINAKIDATGVAYVLQ